MDTGALGRNVTLSHRRHSGCTRCAPGCAVLDLTEGAAQAKEAVVTAAHVLVLAPWLIFGAGLAVIWFRLLTNRSTSRRRRRQS